MRMESHKNHSECAVIAFLRKQTNPPVWNVSILCDPGLRQRPRVKGHSPLLRRSARCCLCSQPPPLPSYHSSERQEYRENDYRRES